MGKRMAMAMRDVLCRRHHRRSMLIRLWRYVYVKSVNFAVFTFVQETVQQFRTSATDGLPLSSIPLLRATYGYNEFAVSTPEPLLLKFAKTIYESPLILLLFGSAVVSAVMGNVDDAVSITIAILIVLTGMFRSSL